MSDLAEAIEEYAELESSELGEYLRALVALARHESVMDEKFRKAMKTEMREQLEWLQENCEIAEVEHTVTKKVRKLVFLNE